MSKLSDKLRKLKWYIENRDLTITRSKKWNETNKFRQKLNRQRYYWKVEKLKRE